MEQWGKGWEDVVGVVFASEMSATWSEKDTWKDSQATVVRPIGLCRVLTLEI